MAGLVHVLRDIALLIARVGFGAVLLLRGWRRWTSDGGMQAQIQYLQQFNTPSAEVMAWGGTLLEIIGGLFLVFGLLTPLVALALVVQQVMVIAWTRWFHGPSIDNGGYEYNVVQICLALLLMAFGAGRAGVDHLFRSAGHDSDDYDDEPEPPERVGGEQTTAERGADEKLDERGAGERPGARSEHAATAERDTPAGSGSAREAGPAGNREAGPAGKKDRSQDGRGGATSVQ